MILKVLPVYKMFWPSIGVQAETVCNVLCHATVVSEINLSDGMVLSDTSNMTQTKDKMDQMQNNTRCRSGPQASDLHSGKLFQSDPSLSYGIIHCGVRIRASRANEQDDLPMVRI